MLKLCVVIPVYNEADIILSTLETLFNQVNSEGQEFDKTKYMVLLVDNMSSDSTIDVVKKYKDENPTLNLEIIQEKNKGVVPARIKGYNYIMETHPEIQYFISGDADITFHKKLIHKVFDTFESSNIDAISIGGCFPDSFWVKVPILVSQYLKQIGSIFFNKDTVERLNFNKDFLSEQIFKDFTRPVSDGCFAIKKKIYLAAGGYTREFVKKDGNNIEMLGEGWRLVFNLERLGGTVLYLNETYYEANPRRILKEPDKFLSASSYAKGMEDLRKITKDDYELLDKLAQDVNLEEIVRYVIDFYIILKCITIPGKISLNKRYFKGISTSFYKDITDWWLNRASFTGNELFELSHTLGDKYAKNIIQNIMQFPNHENI